MTALSYLTLLRSELDAVRDILSRLNEDEPHDELLQAARERLSLAIQYAGELNRRYAAKLEEARRALWIASRSRAPQAGVNRARALVATVLENVRQDVVEWQF